MPRERLIVIGGVAAGMSAASRARKLNPGMEIIVLEKGRHVSVGLCGLPYYLSGDVTDWKELITYDADFFRAKRGIDVRLEHEATAIESGRKTVHLREGGGNELSLQYDKLVLATGAAPAETLPGADATNVFTCNDLPGTIRLREFIEREKPQRAVIVGSGYIGLEVADAFVQRGLLVTIIERSDALLDGIEPEIAGLVEAELLQHGVDLIKGSTANSIEIDSGGRAIAVHHGANGHHATDLVLLSTGVVPRVALAEAAGIALGPTGAIAVDERMLTSANSIYAAGDCTEVRHLVTSAPAYIPLGTTANKQGRVAGENAGGGNATFSGVVGTLVTKVFSVEVAKTGLSLQQARAAGFQPDSFTLTANSRAKYFHGKPIILKLIWERASGRVLGCQMAGQEGVAKRIDVVALALQARMSIDDLLHSDLSYAPPFAPVWEPLLIAAHEAHKKLRS